MKNFLETNKTAWNNRVDVHIQSDFYEFDSFMKGKSSLPSLDIELLGDIRGKSILHLQCHFGMDTLSMARMGVNVTGVDFSNTAIDKAKELSRKLNIDANFICCDVLELPQYLDETFDIVYTSYGVINWLPDLQEWGKVISTMLKTQGKFIMIEFHPVLWMLDEQFKQIEYPYSRKEPFVMKEATYTDNGKKTIDETVTWNYGLSETINGLVQNGISIQEFNEYYYSPFNLSANMIEIAPKEFKVKGLEDKIPVTYSIIGKRI
ncbi:methyltransferase domain-containing protein [Dysgonomonas sp. Marseille-P4677]|uniref:class I SAM-dependent methyltransferase n=1 Tax=Dysgonomonas sp. Marseille-P4677 TaxID=2364790 RepID=UPI0019125C74|nr:class I SAM-dependent methyltransferase [Dysgonomonas sp. Marseille-P4677]MBK5719870.1 methyltransferase domain-containing protein [Dysgonomonas sp. Marseille-P4677]